MMGPLAGLRVVEFTGLGPAPLAGQLLADHGADVICVDRKSKGVDPTDVNRRNKRSIALNLKTEDGRAVAHSIVERADVLIEGFRPGVMEKLGLGPDDFGPHLIYARMTGWGQSGALCDTAGHDLNYLSLSGALHGIGEKDAPPIPPLNLVADFGGGSMFLVFGILAALFEKQRSGMGQVVDAAMTDGVPALMGLIHMLRARGEWNETRKSNLLDGAAPFYRCYECADGKHIAVAPIEPSFYAEMIRIIGLTEGNLPEQYDIKKWHVLHESLANIFRGRTRDEWAKLFEGSDACVSPVLTMTEAANHPHQVDRKTFIENNGVLQAAPAPRFSRSTSSHPKPPDAPGAQTTEILTELGLGPDRIETLHKSGALA